MSNLSDYSTFVNLSYGLTLLVLSVFFGFCVVKYFSLKKKLNEK